MLVSPRGASSLPYWMTKTTHNSIPKEADTIYTELLATDLFSIYRTAFEQVTGQTLALIHPDIISTPEDESSRCKNDFCSLMLDTEVCKNRCTEHTLDLSKRIDQQAFTATCDANITTTLIPVNTKLGIVAYLRSGQVRTDNKEIDPDFFLKVSEAMPPHVARDVVYLFDEAKVYTKDEYKSRLTLLGAFALQLSDLANNLLIKPNPKSGGIVDITKRYIHEKLSEKISLDALAENANVTNSYLCKQFKKATGLTVVEYINRHRIEMAKELLTSKNVRIIEIAYETGFQSLSQFNRSFHRYTGQSPTEYKAELSN
ncbi:helix-turn-helix domain-containing protein [Rubritalea tangerina]|uniref:Helix-turn-helix domain-containing protein n=2 Tax=Rubritalea tangerina TaxID=430798 RepID=A0ABW4Z734_9BACT